MIETLSKAMMSRMAQKFDEPDFVKAMFKLDPLQLFANEAVQGKQLIYLYRIQEDAATASAVQIAFTTENERTKSKDADSTATKDGSIRTPGTSESEVSATSILAQGDTTIDELEAAMDADKLLEIWEVNLANPHESEENKFYATYYQGYLTEVSLSSSAEDYVEVSLTFGLNGDGAKGYATVTQEQQDMAAYVFTDTLATGSTGSTGE